MRMSSRLTARDTSVGKRGTTVQLAKKRSTASERRVGTRERNYRGRYGNGDLAGIVNVNVADNVNVNGSEFAAEL